MNQSVIAVVQTGPNQLDLQEFPRPVIGPDDGLLRIERCAICGSDVEQLRGDLTWVPYPVVPGHEPLGTIEEIGERAARRWGVQVGDRVIVESPVPCRHCEQCAASRFPNCLNKLGYGYTPTSTDPFLFGGYAEHMYLHPNATLHRIAPSVPLNVATYYNALACGVNWASHIGGVGLGDTVVVLGSGQRGIACGIVAKAVGARNVIMTGLTADAHKLELARSLGVDHTVDVQENDIEEAVRELTDGQLADVVIDVVPNEASTVVDAVNITKPGGTIVIAGMKGDVPVPGLFTDHIALKALTVKGVRGKPSRAYDEAIAILESGRFPLELLASTPFPLSAAAEAIAELAGGRITVSLAPNG